MNTQPNSGAGGGSGEAAGGQFRTTRWTLVEAAADTDSPQRRKALGEVLARYLPAMRSHLVNRKRVDPNRADDLLQDFVLKKVFEYNLLGHADRNRGKFRTLLLTALDNFLRSSVRGKPAASEIPEGADPASDAPSPDASFDVPWGRQVIAQALEGMETECKTDNRPDVWGIFEARVLRPTLDGVAAEPYETIISRFKLQSPLQASNLLVTAKRMFERHLRQVIGKYAADDEIDAEIADLAQILSNSAAAER